MPEVIIQALARSVHDGDMTIDRVPLPYQKAVQNLLDAVPHE